jgi:hypothetical protein
MNEPSEHQTNRGEATPDPGAFKIVWTLGFAGKRDLTDVSGARAALRAELRALLAAASQQQAQLVAVSSAAIGGDLVFAEECISAGIPWRALLPFAAAEFLNDQFSSEDRERFSRCLEKAYAVETMATDLSSIQPVAGHPDAEKNAARRVNAYLDCSNRVVEIADLVLFVWDGFRGGIGGSADSWEYAEILKKPVWRWNPQAKRDERHRWPGIAEQGRENEALFEAKPLSNLMAAAQLMSPGAQQDGDTENQRTVRALFHRLDELALREQEHTKVGLQRVLTLHLFATIAAGISFTFLSGQHASPWSLLAVVIAVVALAKPFLAFRAWRHEKALHHDRSQDRWVDARVSAELCRSTLTTWNLPIQPDNVFDVEDFPRFRRLIHSLLTKRALDQGTIATHWTLEKACAHYVELRIREQAAFFDRKQAIARAQHRKWHRRFLVATWYVILGGGILAGAHIGEIYHPEGWEIEIPKWLDHTLACFLIIAPFAATYALAIETIHDTRRRLTRFEVMSRYLHKQIEGISKCRSSVARLRLIAAAERMLVEELHEWDSVTRHTTV